MLAWLTELASISPWLGFRRMSLIVPLCLSIAIVYKTLRVGTLKRLPVAAAGLTVTILLGMAAVGVALLLVYEAVLLTY